MQTRTTTTKCSRAKSEVEMLPITADDMEQLAQAAMLAEFEALRSSAHVTESQHDRMIALSRVLKRGVWSESK